MSWAAVAAATLLAAGCSRDDVTHYRVPKEAPPRPMMAAGMGGAGPAANLPPPAQSSGLRWTLPTGWSESRGGEMRLATFIPPVAGRIDASVVVLPGPAGGELANVNRWRNQIGLGPLDEAAMAKARKILHTKAGALHVYDFTSDGDPRSRVVAGLTSERGDTFFVKLNGDATAVAAAREDFMKLLGSLRFE